MNEKLWMLAAVALTVLLLASIGWLGLRVRPKPFAPYPRPTSVPGTVALPTDLPAPVRRYIETTIGDRVPVVETAVVSGRGRLRIKGLTFPARFRFTHVAGRAYHHYIEATFFGRPVMRVNEWFVDGKARMELPVGVIEHEPKIDEAANMSLWGEAVWFPSILITDSRVRWEAIDSVSARLVVPFEGLGADGDRDSPTQARTASTAGTSAISAATEQELLFTFEPQTGLLLRLDALRWKEPGSPSVEPWRNEPLEWRRINGITVPSLASTTWLEEGSPWAVWEVEDVVYNVDVAGLFAEASTARSSVRD